ncbi:MAG: BON domain-containing protein [Planctomycetes bacterium]|nr:BON domain-containing protein [Planctomycetota bacterium]
MPFAQTGCGVRVDLEWRIKACLRERLPGLKGEIFVTVVGGSAVIRGSVLSLIDKNRCIECCRHVPGVRKVVDDLLVSA